ncbi:MAG: family 43 glycosylhydrolase [Thermogutta sp.]|nr:family 43 glycosylhydrolase [Thermogutta sp.]HPU07913.1 family 43 glycosylhydrolase [Thermogutta sp.]
MQLWHSLSQLRWILLSCLGALSVTVLLEPSETCPGSAMARAEATPRAEPAVELSTDYRDEGPGYICEIRNGRTFYGDTSRRGVPFAKDPSVVRFGDRYLMYYSIPPFAKDRPNNGWAVGIAESRDLGRWKKVGEILPMQECDAKGLAAPCAKVLGGRLHLFYQTYGNGPRDAICVAVSDDGLRFTPHPSNPIFRPSGQWTVGRAIDADVISFKGRLFLAYATRDPSMKIQMLGMATADPESDLGPTAWQQCGEGPILRPELPWEQDCIEAPSMVVRDDKLIMFYAGAYNNRPQQIGVAASDDGLHWKRLFTEPLIPVGPPDAWNASESGHPGVFVDEDGQTYVFYQGNNDQGRTWWITWDRVTWQGTIPYVIPAERQVSQK